MLIRAGGKYVSALGYHSPNGNVGLFAFDLGRQASQDSNRITLGL